MISVVKKSMLSSLIKNNITPTSYRFHECFIIINTFNRNQLIGGSCQNYCWRRPFSYIFIGDAIDGSEIQSNFFGPKSSTGLYRISKFGLELMDKFSSLLSNSSILPETAAKCPQLIPRCCNSFRVY